MQYECTQPRACVFTLGTPCLFGPRSFPILTYICFSLSLSLCLLCLINSGGANPALQSYFHCILSPSHSLLSILILSFSYSLSLSFTSIYSHSLSLFLLFSLPLIHFYLFSFSLSLFLLFSLPLSPSFSLLSSLSLNSIQFNSIQFKGFIGMGNMC